MLSVEAYEIAQDVLAQVSRTRPELRRLPRPVAAIADAWGVRVADVALWSGAGTAGVLLGERVVVISGGIGARRARFTVAHELGHAVFGTSRPVEVCVGTMTPEAAQDERDADAFAAGLLMPHPEVREALAARFGRTPAALSPVEWARRECESGVLTHLVRAFDVSYCTCFRALVDMGLVTGAEPWADVAGCGFWRYRDALRVLRASANRRSGPINAV